MQTQLVVLNVFRLFTSAEVLADRTERRRISLDDGHKDNQLIWPHVEVKKKVKLTLMGMPRSISLFLISIMPIQIEIIVIYMYWLFHMIKNSVNYDKRAPTPNFDLLIF